MSSFKITKEQQAFLNSLTCQRLTKNPQNAALIRSFNNYINTGLARNLLYGWGEDERGGTAYYIVKDQEDRALFYFSVRCGTVYKPGVYQKVRARFLRMKTLRKAMNSGSGPKWALEELESYKEDGQLPDYIRDQININYEQLKNALKRMEDSLAEESNKKIVPTERNYAGIELVHFVKNTRYEDVWEASCMSNHSLGEVVFWEFFGQIVMDLNDLVGCEYVYLFAAELGEEDRLIHFYEDKLKFTVPMDIGTFMPRYDTGCIFMCQKVEDMKKFKRAFFRNYNKPKDAAMV